MQAIGLDSQTGGVAAVDGTVGATNGEGSRRSIGSDFHRVVPVTDENGGGKPGVS